MVHFLKPDLWKLLLTLVLLSVSSFLWRAYLLARISDTFPLGFPFQFYVAWGPCPPGQICAAFNGLFLILDVLAWYMLSFLIAGRLQKA